MAVAVAVAVAVSVLTGLASVVATAAREPRAASPAAASPERAAAAAQTTKTPFKGWALLAAVTLPLTQPAAQARRTAVQAVAVQAAALVLPEDRAVRES